MNTNTETIRTASAQNNHDETRTSCSRLSSLMHSVSSCEQRWVLLTYPPNHVVVFKNSQQQKSLPCVWACDQHSLCEWASVCGPEPKWCRRCLYTMSDCVVSALPTGSYEAAHVLPILWLVCHACVPHRVSESVTLFKRVHQITCQYHFTVPDTRCVFKTATRLLSIFRATVTICQLNYQGTKNIKI